MVVLLLQRCCCRLVMVMVMLEASHGGIESEGGGREPGSIDELSQQVRPAVIEAIQQAKAAERRAFEVVYQQQQQLHMMLSGKE